MPIWLKIKLLNFAITFVFIFSFMAITIDEKIYMEVTSSVAGLTQFFYSSKEGDFAENKSSVSSLQIGENKLTAHFPLQTKFIRWDPVNGSGEFNIKALYVKILFFDIIIPYDDIAANFDIECIVKYPNEISILTSDESLDPSILIKLPQGKILSIYLLTSLILAAIIFTVILFLSENHRKLKKLHTRLSTKIYDERAFFKKLPLLISIACLFWIFSLTGYSISIDDEFAMFRQDHSPWIAQGRWAVFLLTEFILPQPIIPFLPHFIFCVSVSVSYLILVRAHGMELSWKNIALFPIFMAFPTWYFIAGFYANIPAVSMGLIFTSITLLIFSHSLSKINEWKILDKTFFLLIFIQAFILSIAIGCYQSYIFCFLSMGLGIILLKVDQNSSISNRYIIRSLGYLFLIVCASLLLYYSTDFTFKFIYGVSSNTYISGFINLEALLKFPGDVIVSTLHEAKQIYLGSSKIFGVSLGAIGCLLLTGVILSLYSASNWKVRATLLILMFGCIISPFALNILAGGARSIPYRSMVGVPYVIWFFSALAIERKNTVITFLITTLLIISSFQIMNAHSNYSAVKQLSLERDKALAAEIYYRITTLIPGNDKLSSYKVDFFGSKPFNNIFPRIATSTIGGSFFDWDGGNPDRIVTFMKVIGFDNINTIDSGQRRELVGFYDEMPVWPSVDSIKMVDTVFLVKLGERPGLMHQFKEQ